MTAPRNGRQLWQDYLFLTNEMAKFLREGSLEMFGELLEQREKLQTMIEAVDTTDFKTSAEGRKLFDNVRLENALIERELKRQQNAEKKQESLSNSYNQYVQQMTGGKMDQKG